MADARMPVDGAWPMLAILTSVHGARDGDDLILDRKALDGFELYVKDWPGPVAWLLSLEETPPSYAVRCRAQDLPFTVIDVAQDRSDVAAKLPGDALLLAAADSYMDFGLAEAMPGRVVYIIEYTLRTRLDILRGSDASLVRKARTALWEVLTERKRRRAIRAAVGLQCNGLPSYHLYRAIAQAPMVYFDTRLTRALQIDADGLAMKRQTTLGGAPLKLAFSGRLDRMKGAHYLLPLARALKAKGLAFTFEIFGAGALSDELEKAAAGELAGQLILHGPVPFAEELVPAMKERIDLFICPHTQGDPSCTYMETLGCGVPILGFANEAWVSMADGGTFGEVVALGDVDALTKAILALAQDRSRLAEMMSAAALFAQAQPCEEAFEQRVAHLRQILPQGRPVRGG